MRRTATRILPRSCAAVANHRVGTASCSRFDAGRVISESEPGRTCHEPPARSSRYPAAGAAVWLEYTTVDDEHQLTAEHDVERLP